MSEHFIPIEKIKELFDLGLHPIPLRWNLKKKQPDYHPSHGKKDDAKLNWQTTEAMYRSTSPYVNGLGLKLFSPFGMFDFDLKNTDDKTIYDDWIKLIKDRYPAILHKVAIEKTRSGGYHVYIKYSLIGDDKIALAKSANGKEVISIYTGGLLSYCAPTPGYKIIKGDVAKLVRLEHEEFCFMHEAAQMFDVAVVKDRFENDNPFAGLKKKPDEQFLSVIEKIVQSGKDITGGYDRWRNIGFALINEYGEDAREPFREISMFGNYDPDRFDKDFDGFLKSDYRKGAEGQKITIGTFYMLVKDFFPNLEVKLYQYCGFWMNNFKPGNCELNMSRFVKAAVDEGYYSMDGEYVQLRNGVLRRVQRMPLYNALFMLAGREKAVFTVPGDKRKKDSGPITFYVEKHMLRTLAQRVINGVLTKVPLPEFPYNITRDSREETYFHFRNKSICVSREGIREVSREGLYIWADQIIEHDLLDDDGLEYSQFELFIKNISGVNFEYFKSVIGYCLRDCNGAEGLRALWLYDEKYEVGRLNGRTGKSLFAKGLGKMRKMDVNSGKDYDFKDRFKFQNMGRDTQIVVLDDVKENLSFESLFNYCTEGAEFQHKYASRVKLTPEETPKLIITSNFPPPIEQGGSVTGRLIVLPVNDFYAKYIDEGGVKYLHQQVFFTDWDKGEWSLFFHFMISCTHKYFKEGIKHKNESSEVVSRLKAIFYKRLQDQEISDTLAEELISLDKEKFKKFDPDDILKEFGFTDFDVDSKIFRWCLIDFFATMKIGYYKRRERSGTNLKWFWYAKC